MHASFLKTHLSTQKFMAAMLLILLPPLLHMQHCRAEPGDSCEVSDDCDPGERCKRGTCAPRRSSARSAGPGTGNDSPNQQSNPSQQFSGGFHCCDQFGYPRCQIANGPQPIWSGCFCYGQGYGMVCP
jgi:hypothetical protein